MFSNKRGAFTDLKNIILILIVAVILILLSYTLFNEGSRGSDIAACKSFVIFQSAIKDPAMGIPLKELKNPCVTFQDKAEGSKYEVKYEIYDIIAKGMHDVWNMYGSGEIDFLTDKSFLGQFDSNVYCFIGDEISFDKTQEIDIDDFEYYLSNNYPPKNELTYSEIFMKAENTKIDFGNGLINLDPSEKLYIVYAVEKKSPEDYKDVVANFGKAALFSFIGIESLKASIPGAKSLSNKKVFTGTLKASRAPAGGITIGSKFYKGGQFIPANKIAKFGTKILGKINTVGLIVGTIGMAAQVTSDQSVMIPSLMVMTGKDISDYEQGCEPGIHYNPKSSKLGDILKPKNE